MKCEYCKSEDVDICNIGAEEYFVQCDDCGLCGPDKPNEAEAVEAWESLTVKKGTAPRRSLRSFGMQKTVGELREVLK